MLNINMEKVADIITNVADSKIVPRFGKLSAQDIHFKSEDNPVTIADKEAEKELSTRLLDLLVGSKVVGEEAFDKDQSISDCFLGDSPVWIIDPVDGTKPFIAGEPFYGVIVSLAEQNQVVASWLYDPTSKEFVTAQKGAGAYYKGRRLSVLPADSLDNMSGILGRRIHGSFEKKGVHLSPQSNPSIHRMHSSCHDYARLVVDGPHFSGQTTQVHFHSWLCTCTPWDCSAGILIHSEAGGYTAHWNGKAFSPSHYGRGLLSAPSEESWHEIKNWISSCCVFPE